MAKENPAYNKKYNLRLPEELYVRVEKLGRKYDRSANEQIYATDMAGPGLT